MNRTPIRAVAAIVLGLVLISGAATVACAASNGQQQELDEWIETEDCDAEDWAHYEPECHRRSPRPTVSPRKTTAPVKPAGTAPAPRRPTR